MTTDPRSAAPNRSPFAWGPAGPRGSGDVRQSCLDHPLRGRLLTLLRAHPGWSVTDLWHAVQPEDPTLAYGSLTFHLAKLELAGLVASERVGNTRRYYDQPGATPERVAAVAMARSHEDLVRVLSEAPGLSQAELQARLEPTPSRSSLARRLARLVEAGLVVVERPGRVLRYAPTPRLRDALGALAEAPRPPDDDARRQAPPRRLGSTSENAAT